MIEPKLSQYIQNQYAQGTSNETIKSILIKAGWQPKEVELAIKELTLQVADKTQSQTKSWLSTHRYHSLIIFLVLIIFSLGGIYFYMLTTADIRKLADIAYKFSLAKDFEINGTIDLTVKNIHTFKELSFAQLRNETIDPTSFSYGIIKAKFKSRVDTDTKIGGDDTSPFNNRNERLIADVTIETHYRNNPQVFSKQIYSFELSNINQSTYFKLNEYSGFENEKFAKLRNQWLKINPKTIRAALNISTKNDITNNEHPVVGITEEQVQKTRSLLAKNPPFELIDTGEIQPLFENIELQRYTLKLNQQKTQTLLSQLKTDYIDNDLAISITKTIEDYLIEFYNAKFEILADTLTNLPYKLVITLTQGSSPNQSRIDNALIDLSFQNYRRTFSTLPPEDYIDLTVPQESTPASQLP
ncbi:hypothetical protein KBB41_01295 [Candidatus Curtissbacteria bacterium]|nr:hypothetical protein [Candidatus Curtissbacteria bacterium]